MIYKLYKYNYNYRYKDKRQQTHLSSAGMISAARFPTAPLLSARPPAKTERVREAKDERMRDLVSACTFTDFINEPVLPLCFERGGVLFKVNVLLRNGRSTTDTQQLEA